MCHLPTMILFDMKRRHHLWQHLHNRWWNRMLLIADKDIYPELIGSQVWHGKICDTLGEYYLNPRTRVDMMAKWEPFIKQALCFKNVDHSINKKRDIILTDGEKVDEFNDPIIWMSKHVLKQAVEYAESVQIKPYLNPASQ